MKDKNVEQVMLGECTSGRGRVNEEGKEGKCGCCIFYICEYGILKPVEVILRRGRGRRTEGMNQIWVHNIHIWNVTIKPPVQLL
jgi:hypothetical protein